MRSGLLSACLAAFALTACAGELLVLPARVPNPMPTPNSAEMERILETMTQITLGEDVWRAISDVLEAGVLDLSSVSIASDRVPVYEVGPGFGIAPPEELENWLELSHDYALVLERYGVPIGVLYAGYYGGRWIAVSSSFGSECVAVLRGLGPGQRLLADAEDPLGASFVVDGSTLTPVPQCMAWDRPLEHLTSLPAMQQWYNRCPPGHSCGGGGPGAAVASDAAPDPALGGADLGQAAAAVAAVATVVAVAAWRWWPRP